MPVLPIIGLVAAAAGTAVSAVGQAKAGADAQSTANYNAQVAVKNANDTLASGSLAEQQQRTQDRAVIAQGTANAAASGVDATSGSPMDVLAENTRIAELNALNTRRNYQLTAQQQLAGATSDVLQGSAAKTASNYGVASTLLTGGYNVTKGVTGVLQTGIRLPKVPTPGTSTVGDPVTGGASYG